MVKPARDDYVDFGGSTTPIDVGLKKILGEKYLGGASGRGWSSRAAFTKCPHYYNELQHGRVVSSSPALEIGILFHLLVALYYSSLKRPEGALEDEFEPIKSGLLTFGCSGEVVMEAFRLFDAYLFRYEEDYLTPLVVEHREESRNGDTCRYDLIARVLENPHGIPQGTWIVEHKTSSRMDDNTLDGWRSDGEIIGQTMLWYENQLSRRFGALQGVIVNLVVKTRVVDFRRILVSPTAFQRRQHARDLKVYGAFEEICKATNTWPRNRGSCIHRYGKCDLFDACAGSQ